jgi:hypothetical protein
MHGYFTYVPILEILLTPFNINEGAIYENA